MNNLWLVVIGMSLVTYLPRMVPMVILQELKLPKFFKRFLGFIPFAALGALIFPGIIYSTPNIESAVFGGIVSVVFALFNMNLTIVVFSGIMGVYLWGLFFL